MKTCTHVIWQNKYREMIVIDKGQTHTSRVTFCIATEPFALVPTLLHGFGTLKTQHLKALVCNATNFISKRTRESKGIFSWKLQYKNLVSNYKGLQTYVTFIPMQLHLMTHAAITRTSMQPTASKRSLDNPPSDVIREISLQAGIAFLVLLVTLRCLQHVHLCVVVVRMPQDGSKGNILLWQTVKWLVKFVIIGQTIVVNGKITLKSRIAAPFTCMSCKKRLHARLDIVVSVEDS